jgi:phosphoribosylanthranilate isomerase
MSTRIKICGITRLEDAIAAADLGVDALGFVFHPPSPRYIEPERAGEIIRRLPPFVTTVGVFVDREAVGVRETAALAGLDAAQLHGSETPEYCRGLGIRWIKGFRLRSAEDLARLAPYGPDADLLLDSYAKDLSGGTGHTFDWEWAVKAGQYGRIILAGGLSPENVAGAVRQVRPSGVDVSSRVETAPGIKDLARMAAFVQAVREADRS